VEQYITDAEILIKNESYGHAFALTVLGEEELAKAFIYYGCSEELLPEYLVERVGRGYMSHIQKQSMAEILGMTFKILELFQSIAKSTVEESGGDLKKRRLLIRSKLDEAIADLGNKDKIHDRIQDFLERVATIEEDKEIGLYVDVRTVLSSPKLIQKDKAERHLADIRNLYKSTKPLLMTPIPPSEAKCGRALLEESGMLKDFLKQRRC
jgi:AbiV family abortive infection protein